MFFRRREKMKANQHLPELKLTEESTEACHTRFANLDLRRAILDWRDKHIEKVELHLGRELTTLFNSIDAQLEQLSARELILDGKNIGKKHIEPIYLEWVEREVQELINDAGKDLSSIFTHALSFQKLATSFDHNENSKPYLDATLAAGATGAGLAAIPVFASLSSVSAGGLLGMIGATAVSWPVMLAGVATAGALVSFGGYKAANLKSKAVSRYRDTSRKFITQQILGDRAATNSIRKNLQAHISEAATTILKEIDT
ncbi:hypothetical protein [Pseudohalioglobus lutimaris]|uniref:Uncharacterized protein n=1 Tax=Pseudohalioglobus lutimaris TaxID=1737061 RepID=A0A2N5X1T6_9GAMM|nr:hypothetical protein [Pseudohalioglobus lutimaris]PLW68446.1 hypothetical protein C0039_12405 [Pseudohalioglobus lutimaris]